MGEEKEWLERNFNSLLSIDLVWTSLSEFKSSNKIHNYSLKDSYGKVNLQQLPCFLTFFFSYPKSLV